VSLSRALKVQLIVFLDIATMLMHIIVIDFLDIWGMLLPSKWSTTLGGDFEIDFSYATIPTFDQRSFSFYRENFVKYHV